MRNKNLYFITAVLIFTIIFINPMRAAAKTYVATREPNNIVDKEILEPGDVIDFSNSSYSYSYSKYRRYYIYLENELVTDNCFGVEDTCLQQFVVEERMIFQRKISSEENANTESYGINFYKLKSNEEIKEINIREPIYWQDNYVDEHYYKSGDIIKYIFNMDNGTNYYIYDNNNNIIDSYTIGNNNPAIIRLPKINDKDVYWKHFVNLNTGVYKFPMAILRPIEYTEPKIELKCDKDKINYGEKTKCEIYLESPYKMTNLNFSINQKNLKLSNISYLDGVTNSSNDNQTIKLSFGNNNIFGEKRVIMTFDVEGTKDSTYLDKITLNNIEYTDEVVTAKYDDLDSNLNIMSTKPLTNPETGMKGLFVVIPILLLIIVSGLSVLRRKKYEN